MKKVWERTDKPFDTTWYGHLSGYNYYCIYDYCSRFYTMSRLTKPIDDEALGECDVLILKVPTRPYSPEEIETVGRFVKRGGGLLLIGEHTNVFGTGTYLNAVARTFGFPVVLITIQGINPKLGPDLLKHASQFINHERTYFDEIALMRSLHGQVGGDCPPDEFFLEK